MQKKSTNRVLSFMKKGYQFRADAEWQVYLALDLSDGDNGLFDSNLLSYSPRMKEISYTEKGRCFLSEVNALGGENADLVEVVLLTMLYCGEIDKAAKGQYRLSSLSEKTSPSSEYRLCLYDDTFRCSFQWILQHAQKTCSTTRTYKTWGLVSPTGESIVVNNLPVWIREHYTDFNLDAPENFDSVYKRFLELATYMRKGSTRRSTYKGWRLMYLPF